MNQFVQLVNVNFKEFFREPGIIFWAVLFPVLMAWGLGIAFTQKDQLVQKVAIVSENGSFETSNDQWNKLVLQANAVNGKKDFQVSIGDKEMGKVTYEFMPVSWEEAIQLLKKGTTEMIIKIQNDSLQFHFDPNNPEAQLSYLQLNAAVSGNANQKKDFTFEPLEQKGTRYIDFLVPGLLCMSVMMSCMWGISYGMIDKRSKKLLRRMVATPMNKSLFLAAQFVARLALSFVEAAVLLIFCYYYFDVAIVGSFLAFLLIFIAGNIAFTGIAIFASSRTADTRIGNGLVNVVVMPMMILSGVFFSYHNFPEWAVKVIEKLPLTLMADNIRSVFIEGYGLGEVWFPVFLLTAIGTIFFGIGLKIYKWY